MPGVGVSVGGGVGIAVGAAVGVAIGTRAAVVVRVAVAVGSRFGTVGGSEHPAVNRARCARTSADAAARHARNLVRYQEHKRLDPILALAHLAQETISKPTSFRRHSRHSGAIRNP